MPYVVLVVGILGLVAVWTSFRTNSKLAQEKIAKDPALRESVSQGTLTKFIGSLIGSAVIAWAMWGWGIAGIEESFETATAEKSWLSSFVSEHQREWNADCQGILFSQGAQGVIYNPDSGQPYTVAWCESQWSPPVQPTEFSTSEFEQPDAVQPFPSTVLFGANTSEYRCVDQGFQECYDWIVFRGGPG
jgi:hypothetical protein